MLRLLAILSLISFSVFGYGQNYILYNTENGLPSNHVYQIEQDADGFIWFATNMGVVKFDGKNFKTFTTQDGLPTNDIWRLEATTDGKVWYFAKSKKLGYILGDSVFTFRIQGDMPQQPRHFTVYTNKVDFMGSYDESLALYTLDGAQWKPIDLAHRNDYSKMVGKAEYITDGLYLNLANKKAIINSNLDTLFHFKPRKGSSDITYNFTGSVVKSWGFINLGIYVVVNPSAVGIFNFNDSTAYIKQYFVDDNSINTDINFPEVQENQYGIQISKKNDWILLNDDYSVAESKTFKLPRTAVHIFKDTFGNFWMAGHEFGIYAFPKSTLENQYFFLGKKIQSTDYINGQLFINVFDEGWYVLDKQKQEFKLVVPNKGKIYGIGYHHKFNTYYFYNNLCIWAGKDIENIKKIEHITINSKHRGKLNEPAGGKTIIETDEGYKMLNLLYFVEFDSNLNVINNEHKYNDGWKIPIGKTMLTFHGKMYVGGDGLYKINGYGQKPTPIENPLLQVPINTIVPYNNNFILVGTDGFGAYLYDGENKVIQLKGSEGFSVNKIVIYKGDVWLATGKGVHQFKKYKEQYYLVESILDEDGLKGNNVNSICINNDILYVGQDDGLIEIPLTEGKYKKTISPYFYADANYNKEKNAYTIFYGENISLNFGLLSPVSQKYVRYFYKMDTDGKWIPTNVSTLVMGRQLPGNYTVQFKAIDQHGNSGTTHIKLIVKPLWYQTLWIKIFLGIILISLAILITLLYRKRIENKKKKELLLSKTLSELELKALRSQMNPHFVFNSLNAIQYYIVKNKTELSEEYLAKFSRLVRMFFEYSKYDSLTISQEADLLSRYLEIEKLRFEDKLEYTVEVDDEIDADDLQMPSMILQPIVENAVNHGIFHKKGAGKISVIFKNINESNISIIIDDDGVGLLAMKEIQKDSYGNYRSKSSEVIKERMKILSENKLSRWKLEYTITDKSTLTPAGQGTIVKIILTFNQRSHEN